MSVVIRLKSVGTKKKIKHRIVVTDTRFPRDGRFIEEVGTWNPSTKPSTITVKPERIAHWIKNGAKPSDTVRTILNKVAVRAKTK